MLGKKLLLLRIIVAILLIQTLYFKFSAHPDSVSIFSQVGLEPFGRIIIGILELITAALILYPKTIWAGALLSTGLISVAVIMHLTTLGIEVNNDGGTLFFMALVVLILSIIILLKEWGNISTIEVKI
jgi:putative oxidoreductase